MDISRFLNVSEPPRSEETSKRSYRIYSSTSVQLLIFLIAIRSSTLVPPVLSPKKPTEVIILDPIGLSNHLPSDSSLANAY